jgi:hypothetical protein
MACVCIVGKFLWAELCIIFKTSHSPSGSLGDISWLQPIWLRNIDLGHTDSVIGLHFVSNDYHFHVVRRNYLFISRAKRAAWKWAQDRAGVASRWTWLQAQISDLEYRIRQHNEIHRYVTFCCCISFILETCTSVFQICDTCQFNFLKFLKRNVENMWIGQLHQLKMHSSKWNDRSYDEYVTWCDVLVARVRVHHCQLACPSTASVVEVAASHCVTSCIGTCVL